MLDSPSLKALSPPSITRSHTNTIPLSPSSRSRLLQAPSLHFFFLSDAALESLDAKCLSRLSNQPGVQLDTELCSAVLKVLLFLSGFSPCLGTMFEIEMLAPPQLHYYTNQVEICWSKLPCTSTRLGFQPAVSLKYIFQYWILASHTAGEVSPWVRSPAASNPPILLCFWNHILTMHWCTKTTSGLQPASCSEPLTQSVSLEWVRTPYTAQSHIRVIYKCKPIYI